MLIYFQILSTVSGKSIILTISNKKYVFNIFEGFQRLCLENNLSLGSMNTIFLPFKLSVPGFLAVYLTIGNNKCTKNITVVSKKLLKYEKIFKFIGKQDINLQLTNDFKDEYLKVTPWYTEETTNYILEFSEFRNKFLVKKVPKEVPLIFYKQLSKSEVVSYNGIEYDGKNYCENPIKLGKMCIIFSYKPIDEFLEKNPDIKVFFCMNKNALKNIKKYKKKDIILYHVVNNHTIDFKSFYERQKDFNILSDSYLMPITLEKEYNNVTDLQEKIRNELNINNDLNCIIEKDILSNVDKCSENMKKNKNQLNNFKNGIESKISDIKKEFSLNNISEDIEVNLRNGDKLEFSREKLFFLNQSTLENQVKKKNDRVLNSIIFLGTSCAIPTKFRNVSSILYESSDSAMLIDCGEDTTGQILRIFGDCSVLDKLKVIYLSHSHADHVLGVASILNLLKHKVNIIGPTSYKEFLEDISEKEFNYIETDSVKTLEKKFYHEQISLASINYEDNLNNIFFKNIVSNIADYSLFIETEFFTLRICGCSHYIDSASVCITDKLTKKIISYSGDSTPSLLFAACAYNSDIMIHESTFSIDQKKNAKATKHSTDKDAKFIFQISNSKKLLMTHFSNRNHDIIIDTNHAVDFYRFKII